MPAFPLPRQRRIVFGALAALLALALAAAQLRVDANALRPQIEQAASRAFGRVLRIDGDLRLAVFPRPVVELPNGTLFEPHSQRPMATFDRARIGVAPWPLLGGRVEVDSVTIAGLAVTIERRGDGSTSIDDLIGREGAALRWPPPAVELEQARLMLIDADGATLSVSKLDFAAERPMFGEGVRLKLAAAFAAPAAGARGSLAAAGRLQIDPAGALTATSLQGRLTGGVRSDRIGLQADVASLAVGSAVSARAIKLKFWLTGSLARFSVAVEAAGIDGPSHEVSVEGLHLNAVARRGQSSVSARLDGRALASIADGTVLLEGLAGDVAVGHPALREGRLAADLNGGAAVDVVRRTASLDAAAKLGEDRLQARLEATDAESPRVHLDLEAERLDLDRMLAPWRPAADTTAGTDGVLPIDLSALGRLEVKARLRVGELHAGGVHASDVMLTAEASGGRLVLAPFSARLYGGTLAGDAFIDADGHRLGLNAALEAAAVGDLLRSALGREPPLSGHGDVRLSLSTQGARTADPRRALAGSARIELRDGAVRGIDLLHGLRAAGPPTQPADAAGETAFSTLAASFAVRDGVARGDDLQLRSPRLTAGGGGSIDLVGGRLDGALMVTGVESMSGEPGAPQQQLTVPVRISGPFDAIETRFGRPTAAPKAPRQRAAGKPSLGPPGR